MLKFVIYRYSCTSCTTTSPFTSFTYSLIMPCCIILQLRWLAFLSLLPTSQYRPLIQPQSVATYHPIFNTPSWHRNKSMARGGYFYYYLITFSFGIPPSPSTTYSPIGPAHHPRPPPNTLILTDTGIVVGVVDTLILPIDLVASLQ